ncbi:MAG: RagB/SusD family nutrient uptake outer membrane protein [Clostridium sp.]|nr:RagB/SusD family nutrient uptake outer membrane protein [Bacteroides sp.]MCM1198909.1 RagB/SusD family nutrient uptake outer membrane protein [Clostridium sp.]
MKKIYLISTIACLMAMVSCEDFLTRLPKDRLTPETYFTTEMECQLYTNEFYTILPGGSSIYGEEVDCIIPLGLSSEVIGNRTVPATAGTWNWEKLRDINFFLEHSGQCKDETVRNRYVGLARFFRAYFYFEKVKRYGDVPWVDTPIAAEDETLYRGRDDRKTVMQHVLEDIDFAIGNLPSAKNVYSVTRWTALALKSRIFLFEGTFRKYHGLGDWEECLAEAVSAAETFVKTSGYTIYAEGVQPYRDLFASLKAEQTEIILSRAYAANLGLVHDVNGRYTSVSMGRPGVAKDVVNMYLMKDGTRFTDREGFRTMNFVEETKDRDPRLAQTIRTPGYKRVGGSIPVAPDMAATMTGYQIVKYVGEVKYDSYNSSENDLPIFRTAEVFLNLAEAKAELGTLTQADVDATVNRLRKRVGMAELGMDEANASPDPYLSDPVTGYTGVTGPNAGVILEIRRERTVELIAEGFRYWDIMRWKAGKRFERPFYGMYFPGAGEYDLDGNGTVDYVIYSGTKPKEQAGIVYVSLNEANLSPEGYITCHSDITRKFDESKDYLYPIPTRDIILTSGTIKQNPNWEDGLSFE